MSIIVEDWESGNPWGEGWSTNNKWPEIDSAYKYEGNYGARFYGHSTANPPTQSSTFVLTSKSPMHYNMTGYDILSFWVKTISIGQDAGGWGGYFTVSVADGPSWSFTYIDTPSGIWEYHELDVSGLEGEHVITVGWKSVWGDTDVYMDYLVLSSLPYTISGNVQDGDGNNLENVLITFEDSTDYETSTDASGNYLQIVNPDIYTVTASLTKYLDSFASVDASASDQIQNFILSKPVVSGNIKDNNGYNIDGVIVVFTDDASYETTTDSDGNYSQGVDPDEYNVAASLIGYLPDSADVDASSSDQTQDFILNRTTAPHDKGILLESRELVQHNI